MRRDPRLVYRSGYLQFASLTYQGEHLARMREKPSSCATTARYYNGLCVSTSGNQEVFLTRAHAWVGNRTLSYREAQALSERRRAAGKAIDNRIAVCRSA
jgi:putative transposase